ncbi:MAG TPA: hypothetical protein VF524_13235, partial [Polyangia bacterium]
TRPSPAGKRVSPPGVPRRDCAQCGWSVGTLGWTFFAGLAFVFLAPAFSSSRLERRLRLAFLIEGIGCLIGLVGALTQNMVLVGIYFISVTIGGIASSLMAAILFRRLDAQALVAQAAAA